MIPRVEHLFSVENDKITNRKGFKPRNGIRTEEWNLIKN
jgi:hypothetical protein